MDANERPRCSICKRELDVPGDPTSDDCGGDCVLCMAGFGDPDCVAIVAAHDARKKEG